MGVGGLGRGLLSQSSHLAPFLAPQTVLPPPHPAPTPSQSQCLEAASTGRSLLSYLPPLPLASPTRPPSLPIAAVSPKCGPSS